MAIYMKIDGVRATVSDHDHKHSTSSANGGVWKTTNFLTSHAARSGSPGGGPHVKVFSGSSGGSLLEVSQIALASGASPIDGADPAAQFKVEQLFNTARVQQTKIKVFVCPSDPRPSGNAQGRLVVGTDQGIWRTRKPTVANNLKQMPLPALYRGSMEIIVTDNAGSVLRTVPLTNVSVSRSDATGAAPQRSRVTALTVTF